MLRFTMKPFNGNLQMVRYAIPAGADNERDIFFYGCDPQSAKSSNPVKHGNAKKPADWGCGREMMFDDAIGKE